MLTRRRHPRFGFMRTRDWINVWCFLGVVAPLLAFMVTCVIEWAHGR
jgi:hypothetical protein